MGNRNYFYGIVPPGSTGGTGTKGDRGESFNIDMHYLHFYDSDVLDIEHNSNATIDNVYIVTIFHDDRLLKTTPGLENILDRHIIVYNGSSWVDWGLFIGDTGGTGNTGDTGGTGSIGNTGGTGGTGQIGPTLTGGTGGSGGGVQLSAAQYRCSNTITATTAFADVYFDTVDIQNNSMIIKLDTTNKNRIYILRDGLYFIEYGTRVLPSTTTTTSNMRLYKNSTSVIPGSDFTQKTYQNETQDFKGFVIANLISGDYIALQMSRGTEGELTFPAPITLTIYSLIGAIGSSGSTGGTGNTGAPGSSVYTGGTGGTGGVGPIGNIGLTGGTGNTGASGFIYTTSTTPSNPNVGSHWFNPNDNIMYYWDISRSCWLSINRLSFGFGSTNNISNAYIKPMGTITNTAVGYYVSHISKIVSIHISRSNSTASTISIRNLRVEITSLSLPAATTYGDISTNISISSGSILQLYVTSTISNPIITLELAWSV